MKKQPKKFVNGPSSESRDFQVTPEGIRAQMDHILSSPDMKASKKVKTIFRYLTEEALAGREDPISAQGIAKKAYNCPLDPDSQ